MSNYNGGFNRKPTFASNSQIYDKVDELNDKLDSVINSINKKDDIIDSFHDDHEITNLMIKKLQSQYRLLSLKLDKLDETITEYNKNKQDDNDTDTHAKDEPSSPYRSTFMTNRNNHINNKRKRPNMSENTISRKKEIEDDEESNDNHESFMESLRKNDGIHVAEFNFDSSNEDRNPLNNILADIFGKKVHGITGKKDEKEDSEESEEYIEEEFDSNQKFEEINMEINTLEDLYELGNLYPKLLEEEKLNKQQFDDEISQDTDMEDKVIESKTTQNKNKKKKKVGVYEIAGKKYPINLEKLYKLQKPIGKLLSMVGMDKVKHSVFNQLILILQDIVSKKKHGMLHTVIEGPPGVGKTELGRILTDIFAATGLLKGNRIKIARRSDLVSRYTGHTAPDIENLIKNCDVLFIDEAYALGSSNTNEKDTFSIEAINTLNQLLSEEQNNFICIIAGYERELEKSIFSVNPGLKRRFPYRHSIDSYTPEELSLIFKKMINEHKWKVNVSDKRLYEFFNDNKKYFPYFGGDLETFVRKCMEVNAKRTLLKNIRDKRKINDYDIEEGIKTYITNNKYDKNDKVHLPYYL